MSVIVRILSNLSKRGKWYGNDPNHSPKSYSEIIIYAYVNLPVDRFSKNNINDDDVDNNNNQHSHTHHRRRRRRLVVQSQAIEISHQPNNNFPHGAPTDTDDLYMDTLLAINLGFNIYTIII